MKNAKDELLAKVGSSEIVCSKIEYKGTAITLSSFGGEADYEDFLNKLDFNYNSGFGEQYLFGFVVLGDGSWLERGEYDGSEWWELRKKPTTF